MKIVILNGKPSPSPLEDYLLKLQAQLEEKGDQVDHLTLRDWDLKYCTGCWGCWVKTPGLCQADAASQEMDRIVINADFVLWASPLQMGYLSERLKMALDKHLPLIHPYMDVVHGEAHHRKRYQKYPRVGLLLETTPLTDPQDVQLTTEICSRTALNFKTALYFSQTTETSIAGLVEQIHQTHARPLPLPKTPTPTRGVTIPAPARLTLFNGSPRGPRGNSPIFLEQLAKGFGGESEMFNLVNVKSTEAHLKAFREAKCVILAFPLYTDSMPGIVKHFVDALEPYVGRSDNPPIGFIVQSGFPEGLHSRFIERYLEQLANKLGSPYLGTIVKGNGEGVRVMPDEMNRSLFESLQSIGKGLAAGKPFSAAPLSSIAKPERFPAILWPVFKIFIHLPVAHGYFDRMLRENNAYDLRNRQPFLKEQP